MSFDHCHAKLPQPEPASSNDPSWVPFGSIIMRIPGCLRKSFPDDASKEASRQSDGLLDWGFDI